MRLAFDGGEVRASVRRQGQDWVVSIAGEQTTLQILERSGANIRFAAEGVVQQAAFARDGDDLWLDLDGACRRFADLTYAPPQRAGVETQGEVRSPVSGVVVAVEAQAGDAVRRGQPLATVEAMKMHYVLVAPVDGVVAEAHATLGRQARAQTVLFVISAQER